MDHDNEPSPLCRVRRFGKALLVAAVLVALIGIAIIAVGLANTAPPPPFGLAANGQIAYWADGDILVARPGRRPDTALITGPQRDHHPARAMTAPDITPRWHAASDS